MAARRRPLRRLPQADESDIPPLSRETYASLSLADAFHRRIDFVEACQELGLLLRICYKVLSKDLKAVLFNDILLALRLVPEMEGSQQAAAALGLLRAAEAVLPKQRKAAAATEYKKGAVTAHRQQRRDSAHDGGGASEDGAPAATGVAQLPLDTVAAALAFLDARSLARAAAVCRPWRQLAGDGAAWEAHACAMFDAGRLDAVLARFEPLPPGGDQRTRASCQHAERGAHAAGSGAVPAGAAGGPGQGRKARGEEGPGQQRVGGGGEPASDRLERQMHVDRPARSPGTREGGACLGDGRPWRQAFCAAAAGVPSQALASNRVYCTSCYSILWLHPTLYQEKAPEQRGPCIRGRQHSLRPVGPNEVVAILLRGSGMLSDSSSSEGDSDSEWGLEHRYRSRLWCLPSKD